MKYTAALVLAAAAMVSGQCVSDIPSCAQSIIADAATASGCDATDFKCLCDNQDKIVGAASGKVIASCGQEKAINEVLPAAQKFCAAIKAGKTCGSGGETSTPVVSTGPGSATSTGHAETSTAYPSPTSVSASTLTAYPTGSGVVTTGSGNATSTSVSSPTTTVVTAGGAVVGSMGSLAMLVLGALAAF